jgi:sn-glycerol 3-phosphate transport system permease protein
MLDNYLGLTLPLIATATGTFLFRQFFLTIPDELAEAARIDGAGPIRFFFDILLPLSKTNIVALAVIMFVFGWNQYLWPLMVTTRPQFQTAILGLQQLLPGKDSVPHWNITMAATILTMLPPVLVVVFAQRWFVRGLVSPEK